MEAEAVAWGEAAVEAKAEEEAQGDAAVDAEVEAKAEAGEAEPQPRSLCPLEGRLARPQNDKRAVSFEERFKEDL